MKHLKVFEDFKNGSNIDDRILSYMKESDYDSLPLDYKKSLMIWNLYHGDGDFTWDDDFYDDLIFDDSFDWVNDERIEKMAIDFGERFSKKLNHYYRYGSIPTELIKEKLNTISSIINVDSWHRSYQSSNDANHGDSVLPIIVDFEDDYEWIPDGWHRLSYYLHKRLKQIPIIEVKY